MDLALRRDIDEDVALHVGEAAESPSRSEPSEPVVLLLVRTPRREVAVAGLDAVLGERALRRDDLAAAAQAATAAHRVEVDAERSGRVEDGDARLESAAPS
jgi:hypothetical protein